MWPIRLIGLAITSTPPWNHFANAKDLLSISQICWCLRRKRYYFYVDLFLSTSSSSRKSTVYFNSCTLLSYVKAVTCGSDELSQLLYAQGRLSAHLYTQVHTTSNRLMFFSQVEETFSPKCASNVGQLLHRVRGRLYHIPVVRQGGGR